MTEMPEQPQPQPTPAATVAENAWGRVDATGAVFVRTAEGERQVGSYQADEPQAGLAFYVRRYEDLAAEVDLLVQRVGSGAASPEDAQATLRRLRTTVAEAQAVGDLPALAARLDSVATTIEERRAARRAERAKALEAARERKEAIAADAEAVAAGTDWRHGADRLRSLLEDWKGQPRLDKATDDALWRRFSTARTTYTRRRKAHFAELAERREGARAVKEQLVREAEELSSSTDWGPTAGQYRDLMTRWKAAGPAPKDVDDALWKRFRAAQDVFFSARQAAFGERDADERHALQVKEGLLAEAEALLPVQDWKASRDALRGIHERWEAAGRVPRDAVRTIEGRLRRVEEAVREAEQREWRRTNPEGRARAQATVDQLRASIASLEADLATARERGDDRRAADADAAIEARRAWLAEAERALDEFS